jgi:hypothetical protein
LYVSPTHIGSVLIEWEDALKEHEVDLCHDGPIDFLHMDKETKQIPTREFAPEGA